MQDVEDVTKLSFTVTNCTIHIWHKHTSSKAYASTGQ